MHRTDELREAIEATETAREQCAQVAWLLQGIALESDIEMLDELHDRIADHIAEMKKELDEIEDSHTIQHIANHWNLSEY